MADYGSTSTIITREGATPEAFGFDSASDPQGALQAHIDNLRDRASSEVEEFCERVFGLEQGERMRTSGNGTDTLRVRNYPVVSINSLEVGSTTLDADAYQVKSTPGRPNMNAGIIERMGRRVWPRGRKITIDYDWGFDSPPGVVDAVVEDMVVEVLEKAAVDRKSSAKSSESMDGYSVSWDNSDVQDYLTLDESKRQRLEPLKRQGVA